MKTTNVLIGLGLATLAGIGIYRATRKKGGSSASTPDQKASEIIQMGGADVKSSFMGMNTGVKQTCQEKCASLGFGVLRSDPCYCKQEGTSRADGNNTVLVNGMTEFMHL